MPSPEENRSRIRPICRIRSMPPGHSRCEPLIKVENGPRTPLSPTCYKPLIRPENKGIKPKSNRHRPKKFTVGLSHGDRAPGPFPSLPSVENSVHSVHSVKKFRTYFAKRTQLAKSLTLYYSMRNVYFSANLAQKTNPKRTQFLG